MRANSFTGYWWRARPNAAGTWEASATALFRDKDNPDITCTATSNDLHGVADAVGRMELTGISGGGVLADVPGGTVTFHYKASTTLDVLKDKIDWLKDGVLAGEGATFSVSVTTPEPPFTVRAFGNTSNPGKNEKYDDGTEDPYRKEVASVERTADCGYAGLDVPETATVGESVTAELLAYDFDVEEGQPQPSLAGSVAGWYTDTPHKLRLGGRYPGTDTVTGEAIDEGTATFNVELQGQPIAFVTVGAAPPPPVFRLAAAIDVKPKPTIRITRPRGSPDEAKRAESLKELIADPTFTDAPTYRYEWQGVPSSYVYAKRVIKVAEPYPIEFRAEVRGAPKNTQVEWLIPESCGTFKGGKTHKGLSTFKGETHKSLRPTHEWPKELDTGAKEREFIEGVVTVRLIDAATKAVVASDVKKIRIYRGHLGRDVTNFYHTMKCNHLTCGPSTVHAYSGTKGYGGGGGPEGWLKRQKFHRYGGPTVQRNGLNREALSRVRLQRSWVVAPGYLADSGFRPAHWTTVYRTGWGADPEKGPKREEAECAKTYAGDAETDVFRHERPWAYFEAYNKGKKGNARILRADQRVAVWWK